MKEARVVRLLVGGAVAAAVAAACGRGGGAGRADAARLNAALADALRPAALASSLQRMGGAHFHAVTRFQAGTEGAQPVEVTTTTDVWVDRAGNYRLHEDNDRDGGRDVVLYGRELAVALRYGKMIRRAAEQPEPTRLLQEAVGAPGAVYDLAAARARVTAAGSETVARVRGTAFSITRADHAVAPEAAGSPLPPLRGLQAWRRTTAVDTLSGRIVLDEAAGAVLAADLHATFFAKSDAGLVRGDVQVSAALSDIGRTPAIERPTAQELAARQRTVPEQRDLLRGLGPARGPTAPEQPVPAPVKRRVRRSAKQ